jgi:hypothetical protein
MSDALETQLKSIRPNRHKRIRGLSVRKNGESYIIDGDMLTLQEAVQRLTETTAPKVGPDYNFDRFYREGALRW